MALQLGASDIAVIMVLTIFLFIAANLETKAIEKIDLHVQTTKDYAVVMVNPPVDVTDPEEYHKYFAQFGDVVYISVTLRNGTLLCALADKVVLESRIHGVHLRPKWKTYIPTIFPPEAKMKDDLDKLKEKIALLADPSKPPFAVYRVFAIFNTEKEKNNCIEKCTLSYVDYLRGDSTNPFAKFNGKLVNIAEPREPTDTIYDHTDTHSFRRLLSLVISYTVCAIIILISFYIVVAIQKQGASVAIYLTISNSILPTLIQYSTMNIEIHTNESIRQVSMLLKLFVMRCINSGVLIFLAVDYDKTFSITHLQAIQGSKSMIISTVLLFPS